MSKAAVNMLQHIRQQFPVLNQNVHGKPLCYLDNGATTQKPLSVIDALNHYYSHDNSNVHRGVHQLSQRVTDQYEAARQLVADFLNAANANEIIFTRGTTESINLVAHSFIQPLLHAGDEIIISEMEHHANIVPWQVLCEQTGAVLRILPINEQGELELDKFASLINVKTKLLAITHVSNVLGTINPVADMIKLAHQHNVLVLLDGAQAVAHVPVDVRALDADFYVFSAHKIYGPTGVGVLYAKQSLMQQARPYQTGGSMIRQVSFNGTTYAEGPQKFEAGTPNIAGVIGMAKALEFYQQFSITDIMQHEQALYSKAIEKLTTINNLRLIGTAPNKIGVISFVVEDVHAHDVATVLDAEGVAVRAGHHCAMPLNERFQVPATVRASIAIYNNQQDIDSLYRGLVKMRELFT